jgi:hypothetical protein
VLYVYGVIIATLFVMAFLWMALYAAITPLRTGILASVSQYEDDATYESLTLADTFMSNMWTYFLVIVFFGLLYWVIVYSQRKGDVYR